MKTLLRFATGLSATALVGFAGLGTFAGTAWAQSNINSNFKFCWTENAGWLNFRDAGNPVGSGGVQVLPQFMSGSIWGENVGYISLGAGAGGPYLNTTGLNFGINILGNGDLSGYGWGENIGWVNFGTAPQLAAMGSQARYDSASGRIRGYAWSENIGWVNLDDSQKFVGVMCRADFNMDGVVDFFDYLDFVDAFSANDAAADFNVDGVIDFFDYLDFVDAFSAGC